MYWTDTERASMDGTSREVLHNTNLVWPTALTLDYDTQTLYWLDASLDKLETSHVNGSNRRLYHPLWITFYQNRLYWTDLGAQAVLSASIKLPSTVSKVISGRGVYPRVSVSFHWISSQQVCSYDLRNYVIPQLSNAMVPSSLMCMMYTCHLHA